MRSRLLPRRDLEAADRRRMLELFDRSFVGVSAERFAADLEEKSHVLLLEDEAGRLEGFSTLLYYRTEVTGEPLSVVYSGDTVVDAAAWGSSLLAPAWIAAVRRLHRRLGEDRPLFWLLIVSGYRTYRFLPLFWQSFHPRHDRSTPPAVKRRVDLLAGERFADAYDPATGIVRFADPQVLRPELSGIPEARQRNLHVAFFAAKNPGHAAGDELVCLTELSESNLTAAGRRMVRRGESRREA